MKRVEEDFEGWKTCRKCTANYQKKTSHFLYCHTCERRVNPEIWDFHLVGGCHKENMMKQLLKDYKRLIEEAPPEFKETYLEEGQAKINDIKKKTLCWLNTDLSVAK